MYECWRHTIIVSEDYVGVYECRRIMLEYIRVSEEYVRVHECVGGYD